MIFVVAKLAQSALFKYLNSFIVLSYFPLQKYMLEVRLLAILTLTAPRKFAADDILNSFLFFISYDISCELSV